MITHFIIGGILFLSFNVLSLNSNEAQPHQLKIIFAAGMNEISSNTQSAYPQLAYFLKKHRSQSTPTFFFFGGGSIGPSMLSSFDRGSHIIDLLNQIEPDVMTVTKRDFSFFENELSLRAYEAAFPVVSSNVVYKENAESLDGLVNYAITQQDDYKIAVLSTLAKRSIEEYNLTNINILDKNRAIKNHVNWIKQNDPVDFFVLINTGIDNNVVSLLNEGIVDLIIQKDSDIKDRHEQKLPVHPNYIFVTNVDEIALLTLRWDDKSKKELKVDSEFYPYNTLLHDQPTQLLVESYESRLDSLLNDVIGVNQVTMNTKRAFVRKNESRFANLLTDAMKDYTDADISFVNGGMIRGDRHYQPNQKITRRDIIRELPYRNKIMLLELTGEQIYQAIEHGLGGIDNLLGRFLHTSGLEIVYQHTKTKSYQLLSVNYKGKPLDKNAKYKVTMSDFLANGGDDFTMWQHAPRIKFNRQSNILLSDILINYIRQNYQVSPQLEQRLVEKNTLKQTQ